MIVCCEAPSIRGGVTDVSRGIVTSSYWFETVCKYSIAIGKIRQSEFCLLMTSVRTDSEVAIFLDFMRDCHGSVECNKEQGEEKGDCLAKEVHCSVAVDYIS